MGRTPTPMSNATVVMRLQHRYLLQVSRIMLQVPILYFSRSNRVASTPCPRVSGGTTPVNDNEYGQRGDQHESAAKKNGVCDAKGCCMCDADVKEGAMTEPRYTASTGNLIRGSLELAANDLGFRVEIISFDDLAGSIIFHVRLV